MATFLDDQGRPFKVQPDASGKLVKTVEIAEDGRVRTLVEPYENPRGSVSDRAALGRAGVDLGSLDRAAQAFAGHAVDRARTVDAAAQKSLPSPENECEHCGHQNPADHEGLCYGCGLQLQTQEEKAVEKRRQAEEAEELAEYVRLANHPNSEMARIGTDQLIRRVGPVRAASLITDTAPGGTR